MDPYRGESTQDKTNRGVAWHWARYDWGGIAKIDRLLAYGAIFVVEANGEYLAFDENGALRSDEILNMDRYDRVLAPPFRFRLRLAPRDGQSFQIDGNWLIERYSDQKHTMDLLAYYRSDIAIDNMMLVGTKLFWTITEKEKWWAIWIDNALQRVWNRPLALPLPVRDSGQIDTSAQKTPCWAISTRSMVVVQGVMGANSISVWITNRGVTSDHSLPGQVCAVAGDGIGVYIVFQDKKCDCSMLWMITIEEKFQLVEQVELTDEANLDAGASVTAVTTFGDYVVVAKGGRVGVIRKAQAILELFQPNIPMSRPLSERVARYRMLTGKKE